jgi:hypothetical protein
MFQALLGGMQLGYSDMIISDVNRFSCLWSSHFMEALKKMAWLINKSPFSNG